MNQPFWNRPGLGLSVLYIGHRNRWWLLIAALLGSLIAGASAHFLLKTYRASALILVEPQKVPDKYVNSAVSTDVQDRLASISQQILSNTRLQKIIDDFHLYRDESKRLYAEEILDLMRRNISIKLERGWSNDRPGAFHVAFEGSDPGIVAEVTNRLVSLFLEENLREREMSAEGTSDFLETELQDARKKLEIQENEVAQYKLQHEGALPGQDGMLNGILNRLQQELQYTEEAIARDRLSKSSVQNSMQAGHSSDDLAAQLVVKTAEQRVEKPKRSQQLSAELDAAKLKYTANFPAVAELEIQLAAALAAEKKEDAAKPAATPTDSPQYLQWQINSKLRDEGFKNEIRILDQDIADREKQRQDLRAEIAKYQRQLADLPVRELQMGAITRDYEMSLANYKSLLDKRQSARISTEMERRQKGESFRILDPARTPQKTQGLPLFAWFGIGALAGLLLTWTAAVSISFFRDQLLGEWELPSDLPILVRIPAISPADLSSNYPHLNPPQPRAIGGIFKVALPVAFALLAAVFCVYRFYFHGQI